MKSPIIITGTQRSGVSMIGGVVYLCGARGGRIAKAVNYDGRGPFENTEIRDSIVKPFLRGIGADITGQKPLPDLKRCREVAPEIGGTWRSRVIKIAHSQNFRDGTFFYASPSACLIWPQWHAAFPDARWVIVRRRDEDIISSCLQTGYMSAYSDRDGWQAWIDSHKQRFTEMLNEGLDVWQVWPHSMIAGQLQRLREMVLHLELNWNAQDVEDFIAPILWIGSVFQVEGADG